MSYIMVDVEADGPIPGDYSIVSFGAVVVEPSLEKVFYDKTKPISEKWIPEALAISKVSRKEHLGYNDPKNVMSEFSTWVKQNSTNRPIFISDNNGFDWMFICWYLQHFTGSNIFGHSSMNLGSFYKGLVKNVRKNFKHLRKVKHTHNLIDDAKGNANALLEINRMFELDLELI